MKKNILIILLLVVIAILGFLFYRYIQLWDMARAQFNRFEKAENDKRLYKLQLDSCSLSNERLRKYYREQLDSCSKK